MISESFLISVPLIFYRLESFTFDIIFALIIYSFVICFKILLIDYLHRLYPSIFQDSSKKYNEINDTQSAKIKLDDLQ